MGTGAQGTMEAQAEAGDPWRDNGLVTTSPLSQLLALSTLGIRAREPFGSDYSAVLCFLKAAFIFSFSLTRLLMEINSHQTLEFMC